MGRAWLGAMIIGMWLGGLHASAQAAAASPGYWLDINLDSATMYLMHGERLVKAYHAALGKGGLGKQIRGDNKTPVGRYHIVDIRPSDRFRTFMHLSYPNQDDINQAYGRGVLDWSEYERLLDGMARNGVAPQNSPLGGVVGVHGMGTSDPVLLTYHRTHNWTNGCVALTDREIDELSAALDVGAVVMIRSNRIAPDLLLARQRVPVLPFGGEDTLLGLSRGPGGGVALQGVSLGLYGEAWRLPMSGMVGGGGAALMAGAAGQPFRQAPAVVQQSLSAQRVAALQTAGPPAGQQGGHAPAGDGLLPGVPDSRAAAAPQAVLQVMNKPVPRTQPMRPSRGPGIEPRSAGWGGPTSKPLLGGMYSPAP